MKSGDKVYCKEDCYYNDYFGSYLIHKKGKTYKISHISEEYYKYIVFVEVEKTVAPFISNDVSGYYLKINNTRQPKVVISRLWNNFYDHFLTMSEYRKLKLKKLNEI